MDAHEIEEAWQRTMLGVDEPDCMYILGKTLKEWARNMGKPAEQTTDGFPIYNDEMYLVTHEGIWRVE